MNFGPLVEEAESHKRLDAAVEQGINFIDTADVYGWKTGQGWTEQIVGRWLAQGGGRRESIVLATKLGGPMGDGPNQRGLSAYHIRRACDASLKRLGTDHIDVYQMHHVFREVPWEEVLSALEQLVTAGKVLYLGSSNFAGWDIATANQLASCRHAPGLVSEQSHYNLAERSVELEVLPACRHYGMALLAWSPLGGGLLAGPKDQAVSSGSRRSGDRIKARRALLAEPIARFEELCREIGRPAAQVALAWLRAAPREVIPVIGPRTGQQLRDCIEAASLSLDEAALAALEEIWPGPGQAPEAYAW